METFDTQSRIAVLEHEIKDVKEDVKALSHKVESNHRETMDKIDSMEKWRWMMIGGSIVIGYILGHIKLEKLL